MFTCAAVQLTELCDHNVKLTVVPLILRYIMILITPRVDNMYNKD